MNTIRLGSRGEDVRTLQNSLSLHVDGIFGPISDEAVRDFQKSHSLVVDGVVGPKTWAALGIASPSQPVSPSTRRIDMIILHCSATPDGKDYTVDQIRQCHIARGFSDVGYHFIVYRDGSVHRGRPVEQIGSHTKGYNSHSIGICYIGGNSADNEKPKDTRTPQQRKALRELVDSLLKKYPRATVHGHYEFANKACPSFKICDL